METPILKNGMFVVSPISNDYLTKGKSYRVFNVKKSKNLGYSFQFISDAGIEETGLLNCCAHLDYANWIFHLEEPTTSKPKPTPNILAILYGVAVTTDNTYTANQLLKLKHLAEQTPNDLEFGAIIRKMLNEIDN
jgi:hypothetical protein